MPTTRSGTASGHGSSSAQNEIIKMLKEDHKQAKKCFADFEKLDVHEDSEECQALVRQAIGELEVHAALEEEIFYPAARGALDEEDLIDEAEVEHMTVHMLVEQLKDMAPEEEKYAATFKVLGEYVKHHIEEEEKEILPQVAKAKLDWDALLQQMTERREELAEQLMPGAVEHEAPAAKGKAKSKQKKQEKDQERASRRETEEMEEEAEELADADWEHPPYVDPALDEE